MANTGITSTSFRVWAVTASTSLAGAVFAGVKHQYWGAIAALGFSAVAGIAKTWHDKGLRVAEHQATADVQAAFYYAVKHTSEATAVHQSDVPSASPETPPAV